MRGTILMMHEVHVSSRKGPRVTYQVSVNFYTCPWDISLEHLLLAFLKAQIKGGLSEYFEGSSANTGEGWRAWQRREKEWKRKAEYLWWLLLLGQRRRVLYSTAGLLTSGAHCLERIVANGSEELLDQGGCLLFKKVGTIWRYIPANPTSTFQGAALHCPHKTQAVHSSPLLYSGILSKTPRQCLKLQIVLNPTCTMFFPMYIDLLTEIKHFLAFFLHIQIARITALALWSLY